MRALTNREEKNVEILTKYSVEVCLIEPTETGLKKSIMDATAQVRNYLKKNNLHDYEQQNQGQQSKIIIEGFIYTNSLIVSSKVSLYRPNTKKGDPRIWFSGLTQHAEANDILALVCFNSQIHVINIIQLDLNHVVSLQIKTPLKELIEEIYHQQNSIADELLMLLRNLARKGAIRSEVVADTSVGRTLETALGIPINSSKTPDYKGIELKSFRSGRNNRKNLFTQVPDWNLSKFKGSGEILDAFGYERGSDFKLYCIVSAANFNSQRLSLKVEHDLSRLVEFTDIKSIGDFAVWELQKLHERLEEKHKETFWISAISTFEDGIEYFQYEKVRHTKKPILSQFDILLEQGGVTLDHLIKRTKVGGVYEKGPIFKIKPAALSILFPPSQNYELI